MSVMTSRRIAIAEIKLSEAEIAAAVAVLRSGALRQGKQCEAFEAEFAAKVGARHAIACANGSATLHLLYLAWLRPGDEVLVPSFTFIATGSMVSAAGGRPVFCDIDPETFLIDLADAERRVTPRTRAIAPVHLFGNACDVEAVQAFAARHGLKIVWDAAQAHGATWRGRDIGGLGDAVSYSFYPSKNMFVGEGGMITTPDGELAARLRLMRSHGAAGRYYHTVDGLNYRMTDVEAAIGREQLKRLDAMLLQRRANFSALNAILANVPGVSPQKVTPGSEHAVHQYCVRIRPELAGIDRDELQRRLKERGIETGIHYPRGLHQQPVFVARHGEQHLPVTEELATQILALPVHHGMSEDDAAHAGRAVVACLG
jgi:perosamine synthetase